MSVVAVVLAAGLGTRMHSLKPKVLHEAAGATLLEWVLIALYRAGVDTVRVVVSPDLLHLESFIALQSKFGFEHFMQNERLGTGHALIQAVSDLDDANKVVVVNGDSPLISAETVRALSLVSEHDIVCGAFEAMDPSGYGRLLTDGELVTDIIEEKDASNEQKAVHLCNAGVYLFNKVRLRSLLSQINSDNASQEYYLTDIIKIASSKKLKVGCMIIPESNTLGVNSKSQLAKVESLLQQRLREYALNSGVTIVDPDTVFFSYDIKFGKDVVIEPFNYFGPGVVLGDGCVIRSFCHIEKTHIGKSSVIGPFARLREQTVIGDENRIGNFVEVKNATTEDGTKAAHLSYIGDASVGKNVNIGAGAVFCNYDGIRKNRTFVADRVFIGSNTSLVAPLNLGESSIIGAGSVITHDVGKDKLAIARSRQVEMDRKSKGDK